MSLPPGVHAQFPLDPLGSGIDTFALTPLFKQYVEIKQQYPQALLLYRLGDFYEMFGPDAVHVSKLLGLTLTSRGCAKDYKVAMCGVPHHSAARYIKRLIGAGEIIAICEQTEDAAEAKGLVERAVTRLITAGTLVEDEYLAEDSGNYLGVIALRGGGASLRYGLALLESSGGAVELSELTVGADHRSAHLEDLNDVGRPMVGPYKYLLDTLLKARPAELLIPASLRADPDFMELLRDATASALIQPALHSYDSLPGEAECELYLQRYFKLPALTPFGIDAAPAAQAALFALARYLRETFKVGELSLYPRLVPLEGTLHLDPRSLAHLDVLGSEGSGGGLYALLNRCRTAAGKRRLRRLLAAPLADRAAIGLRHSAIETLLSQRNEGTQLSALLGSLQDLERILSRLGLGRSHPKELRALADSLIPLSQLGAALRGSSAALLSQLGHAIADFTPLAEALLSSLAEEAPVKLSDGGVIRDGVDSRVDELRALTGGGAQWFRDYETAQRERTGIRTLKVKHTDAFGWFIEISKGSLNLVPTDYNRRQTLVNAERFTTPELSAREADAREAGGKLLARERELFEALCQLAVAQSAPIAAAMQAAAEADVLLGFASLAKEHGWVKPEITNAECRMMNAESKSDQRAEELRENSALSTQHSALLEIVAGRHPLLEAQLGSRYYTPNDCFLDGESQQVLLLTGPNMGGKSTYLRMVAVLCLMAQCGSFVPAQSARLPLLRRIYTRVGAQDALNRGQSTFMVEMLETAEILSTCGPDSLIILDEVGRGTSTYDGISIAKAVLEFLHEHPARPLTLFATHFFELTDLPLVLPRAKNFQVEVLREISTPVGAGLVPARDGQDQDGRGQAPPLQGKEERTASERFVFSYRVIPGAASDSYGIEVAALAGLPPAVVARAREILRELEEAKRESRERARQAVQLGLFA